MADIYLIIKGRAGNQLSQYAFALLLKEKLGFEKIYADFSLLKNENDLKSDSDNYVFQDDLQLFQTNYSVCNQVCLNLKIKIIWKLSRLIDYIWIKLFKTQGFFRLPNIEKKTWRYFVKHGIFSIYNIENISAFLLELDDINVSGNIMIEGLYEDYRIHELVRCRLLEYFTPKLPALSKNEYIYRQAQLENSVCISIRRGDFLNERFKNRHFVTDEEYYHSAIEVIKKLVPNPKFIVFSDDIKYAKSILKDITDTVFEEGGDDVAEKIRMMSMCHHFILSNSTFSYWAMYLGDRDGKKVIAPSIWKRPKKGYGIFSNLLMPDFILINID